MDFISSVFAIKEEIDEENTNSTHELAGVETEYTVDLPRTPWPRFNKFLLYRNTNGNNHIFQCKLCLPKKHEVRAHKSSYSNIRSHFRKKHPIRFGEVDRVCRTASVRGRKGFNHANPVPTKSQQIVVKSLKLIPEQTVPKSLSLIPKQTAKKSLNGFSQPHILDSVNNDASCSSCLSVPNANVATQTDPDNQALLDLIINGMHPLRIVDCSWFRKYSKDLNPSATILSSQTLGRKILHLYDERKTQLIRALNDVKWVATTCDFWTSTDKGFLAMTVHWLDRKTLQRKHGALTCVTVQTEGRRTYNRIVQAIGKVYVDYGIAYKVTMTTTDNARNFAPTFVQFGQDGNLFQQSRTSSVPQLHDNDSLSHPKLEHLLEDIKDKKDEFLSLADLAANEEEEVKPANHIQCAAHIWNLIASDDSEAALHDVVFREAYVVAIEKAKPLWESQNQNVSFLTKKRNRTMAVETEFRWKSLYESIVCLLQISEENKKELHRVMALNGLEVFTKLDMNFFTEFVTVMNPLATVVDLIQSERAAYLGWLLPLCATTAFKLHKQKQNQLQFCEPLVNALLSGINKRFGPLLNSDECLLASAFHPRFRLCWMDKWDRAQEMKESILKLVELKVEEYLIQEMQRISAPKNNKTKSDDFLSIISTKECLMTSPKFRARSLVQTWLSGKLVDNLQEGTFLNEEVFLKLFIRYNTAIPSGSPVEKVFSLQEDLNKATRSRLNDETRNILLFLKGNKHNASEEKAL